MKKMLVLGMTLVVLFVGIAIANAHSNIDTETSVPDDNALINWYIKYDEGQEYQAIILDGLGDDEYIGFAVYDYEGNRTAFGSVDRSYAMNLYKIYNRNN